MQQGVRCTLCVGLCACGWHAPESEELRNALCGRGCDRGVLGVHCIDVPCEVWESEGSSVWLRCTVGEEVHPCVVH